MLPGAISSLNRSSLGATNTGPYLIQSNLVSNSWWNHWLVQQVSHLRICKVLLCWPQISIRTRLKWLLAFSIIHSPFHISGFLKSPFRTILGIWLVSLPSFRVFRGPCGSQVDDRVGFESLTHLVAKCWTKRNAAFLSEMQHLICKSHYFSSLSTAKDAPCSIREEQKHYFDRDLNPVWTSLSQD